MDESGSPSVASESDVHDALTEIEQIEAEIEETETALAASELWVSLQALKAEREKLRAEIDAFILSNYQPSEGYDDGVYKLTKVVGHTRKWNVDKLKSLVPHAMFKRLTSTKVEPSKIDEMIRAKKLAIEEVQDAYEERPNKPYVKMTKKSQGSNGDEAAELAAKLA